MANVAASANDPIFLNHHAMVDCIFETWLQKNPNATYPTATEIPQGHRKQDYIVPFFPLYKHEDMFSTADKFGYKCKIKPHKSDQSKKKIIIIAAVVGTVAFILLLVLIIAVTVLCVRHKRKKNNTSPGCPTTGPNEMPKPEPNENMALSPSKPVIDHDSESPEISKKPPSKTKRHKKDLSHEKTPLVKSVDSTENA